MLMIDEKVSEPAKSCTANATGLQRQEQVLMQNIVAGFGRSMMTAIVYCFLLQAWSQSSRVARRRSEQDMISEKRKCHIGSLIFRHLLNVSLQLSTVHVSWTLHPRRCCYRWLAPAASFSYQCGHVAALLSRDLKT